MTSTRDNSSAPRRAFADLDGRGAISAPTLAGVAGVAGGVGVTTVARALRGLDRGVFTGRGRRSGMPWHRRVPGNLGGPLVRLEHPHRQQLRPPAPGAAGCTGKAHPVHGRAEVAQHDRFGHRLQLLGRASVIEDLHHQPHQPLRFHPHGRVSRQVRGDRRSGPTGRPVLLRQRRLVAHPTQPEPRITVALTEPTSIGTSIGATGAGVRWCWVRAQRCGGHGRPSSAGGEWDAAPPQHGVEGSRRDGNGTGGSPSRRGHYRSVGTMPAGGPVDHCS
jgi:hypothetical protein